MKRIAIIVPSLYGGGAEKVAVLLSKGLLVRGNKVFLLALEGGLSYDIPRGVNYMQLSPLDGRANKLLKFFIMPYQWYQIAKFFNKYRIEFAISIMERPNLLLALLHILSIGRKIISVASVHTLLVERAANKKLHVFWRIFYKYLYIFISKHVDCVVAVSPYTKNELVNEFNLDEKSVKFIGNPVEFQKIKMHMREPLNPQYANIFESKVIINIGRLVPEKGQMLLIETFSLVRKVYKDLKLVLIGEGPNKGKLIELVDKLGLREDVTFLGFQKNPYKYLKRSKIFILTSRYEGFGLALLEAMACELPVVTITPSVSWILGCGLGNDEMEDGIIYAKYGIYVPIERKNVDKNDILKRLASVIIILLEDKKLYQKYTEASMRRAKDFSLEIIASKYDNLLEELSFKRGKFL